MHCAGCRADQPAARQESAGPMPRALTSLPETTTISYSYDPLYRLTGASYSGTLTNNFAYTYDAVGNRQTQVVDGTTTSYVYDIANRLTTVNGVMYTWDDNGNLLNDGVQTYTYDQANRLKQAAQGANTYTFGYNGVGDRLSQTVNGVQTRYVLDPAAGLTQVLADGTNTYLYGNERLAQYQAAMQYFGADGLGSVRQIFDASAMVVGSSRYDPFGNVMAQSGTVSVFAFAGEQQDATGLEYLRARYYSSAQGRFTRRCGRATRTPPCLTMRGTTPMAIRSTTPTARDASSMKAPSRRMRNTAAIAVGSIGPTWGSSQATRC